MNRNTRRRKPGHGAVGVVVEDSKFLVIRRSATVRAPNFLCFAGGTIEIGETPEHAIVREMKEELDLEVSVESQVWQSRTSWGTLLEWMHITREPGSEPVANPEEVGDWFWLTGRELLCKTDLLPSVPAFYRAWALAEFSLPAAAGQPESSWKHLRV